MSKHFALDFLSPFGTCERELDVQNWVMSSSHIHEQILWLTCRSFLANCTINMTLVTNRIRTVDAWVAIYMLTTRKQNFLLHKKKLHRKWRIGRLFKVSHDDTRHTTSTWTIRVDRSKIFNQTHSTKHNCYAQHTCHSGESPTLVFHFFFPIDRPTKFISLVGSAWGK